MSDLDLLIIVFYGICTFIILSQAIKSLEDRTVVQVDLDALKQHLKNRQLENWINIKFGLKDDDRYPFDKQPRKLSITVENKSNEYPIFVNWDRSSFTDFDGRSRRVVRLNPAQQFALFEAQATSVIAPKASLKEEITAEDLLKPTENGNLDISNSLVDLIQLRKMAEAKKPRKDIETLYRNFMESRAVVKFSLWLQVSVPESDLTNAGDRSHLICCDFEVKKMPWHDYLPLPKK
jgi:hypothetical protein